MDNTKSICNEDGKITQFYLRRFTLKLLEEKLSERVGEYHSKLIAPTYFDIFYSCYCESGGLLNCGDIKAITGKAFEHFYRFSKYLDLQDSNNIIFNSIKESGKSFEKIITQIKEVSEKKDIEIQLLKEQIELINKQMNSMMTDVENIKERNFIDTNKKND